MHRNNLLAVAGVAAALLPIEAFFGFGLWFAPGWANEWPGGLPIHLVWPVGMTAVATAILLTMAVGFGAAVAASHQAESGAPLSGRAARLWVVVAVVSAAIVSPFVFGYFHTAALESWPNGYNSRGNPNQ